MHFIAHGRENGCLAETDFNTLDVWVGSFSGGQGKQTADDNTFDG